MAAIYSHPGEVRWVRRDDGTLALQQLWEKHSAPEKGKPRIQNVWRSVAEPPPLTINAGDDPARTSGPGVARAPDPERESDPAPTTEGHK